MRYIGKRLHGSIKLNRLSRAHQTPPQNADDARSRWSSLDKVGILDLLLLEQYGLCCYSEIRADEYGFGYHIEHVENKSQNPARTFDYTNLLASAFHSDNLGLVLRKHVFGGHAIGKIGRNGAVNMNLFVSPLQGDCDRFFTYQLNGEISPSSQLNQYDRQRADYTIQILNLNSPELVTRREQLWKELEDLFDQHCLPGYDLVCWLEIELIPRLDRSAGYDKLESFFSLKRQFFAGLEQSVLANYKNGALL